MPWASVDQARFWYEERGRGAACVLVHGFPLDGRIWAGQIEAICKSARVIAPDLRGFGRTKSDQPFTIESLADDLHALLAGIDALPCVLCGLSMGGYVSLVYARKYPADLGGLALVDTRADADTPAGKVGREQMIQLVRAGGSGAIADAMIPKLVAPGGPVEQVRSIILDCPALTIEHALAAMRDRADCTAVLGGLTVPVNVIVGQHDAITPPSGAEEMARRIRGSRLTIIAGAGHLSPMERPGAVSEAIQSLL